MLVVYKGRLPALMTEYNGKRYSFSKENPIQEIPPEVFIFLMRSGHVHAEDVKPYDEGYKLRIIELEKEIEDLKKSQRPIMEKKPKAVKYGSKKKQ